MKIRNRYQERKERAKNDIQKVKLQRFFDIKFKDNEEYYRFLDLLHKPMSFKKSMEINEAMISELVSDGKNIEGIIEDFNQYIDDYCARLISGEEENEDKSEEYYRDLVEETIEDGLRQFEDLHRVIFLYKDFLKNQKDKHIRDRFKKKKK